MTLGNPDLDTGLRRDLEEQYVTARQRIVELEAELVALNTREEAVRTSLDPEAVLDRLHRLADVLAEGNPTRTNIELAHHIVHIDCFSDGRVVMLTHKLGCFEVLQDLLSDPNGSLAETCQEEEPTPGRIKERRLPARRRHGAKSPVSAERAARAADPDRFKHLAGRFVWRDEFRISQTNSWSARHAREVAQLLAETGWTRKKLAAHFGVSKPTIRKALKMAEEQR